MKKTIRINISGLIFNIDEDAYNKLSNYLESINRKFVNTEEGHEIISDVETRVAELFQERIGDRKEVVSLSDVDHVIEILGAPEDFEEIADTEVLTDEEAGDKRAHKRIYRDSESRVLGGVAAGIAAYFNIDTIIVRVIFVLFSLFYGTSVVVYVLLWIILPEAKTRSQKLEMRGQDINLSNIETSIKSEFRQVKSNFEKWQKSGGTGRLASNISNAANVLSSVILIIAKIILIGLGIGFLFFGLGILGTMTGLFFMDNTIMSPFSWNDINYSVFDLVTLFTDGFNARVGIISTYLLILIPSLSLIYLGIRFIFRFKTKNRYIGVFAGSLWVVSLFVLLFSILKVNYGLRSTEEISQSYVIESAVQDTFYIEVDYTDDVNYHDNKFAHFNNLIFNLENEKINLLGNPGLDIVKSPNDKLSLTVIKRANGMNKDEALKYVKNIRYDWQQVDSLIKFNRYYSIEGPQKYKSQQLEMRLEIPVGKIFWIGDKVDYFASYFEIYNNNWIDNYTWQYWIMTESGMRQLDDYKNDMKDGKIGNDDLDKEEDLGKNSENEIEQMKSELDSM